MSPIQTQKQIKERVPLLKPQTQAKGKLSLAEQTAQYLAQRKQNLMERAQIADMEVATEESKREAARIRKETERIESGKDGDGGGGDRPDGPGDGSGGPKGDESRIWQVDEEKLRVRAARQGEPALTFNEASEVIREMKSGHDVPIIIFNATTGKHEPNPENDWVKNNPQVALATAKLYDEQLAGGKQPDVWEIFLEQKKKEGEMRQALGLPPVGGAQTDEVKVLREEIAKMREDSIKGEIAALRTEITTKLATMGNDDPKVAALEASLKELTAQLQKDREDRMKAELEAVKTQNSQLSARIEQVAKEKSTDSEIGLMKDIVQTGQHGADKVVDLITSLAGQGGPKLPTVATKVKTAIVAKVTGNPVADPELVNLETTILEGRTQPGGR